MRFARSELGAAVIEGHIYAVGGLTAGGTPLPVLEIYDPVSDTWLQGPPMPQPRHHAGVAAVNGRLYVIGGYGSGAYPWDNAAAATVFEFDPVAKQWAEKEPMARPRAAFTAVAVDGKIHCIGGLAGRVHEAYDAAQDAWETLPDMPSGREHLASVVIGTTLYAIGGRHTGDPRDFERTTRNFGALEAYDTLTRAWTQLPRMEPARGGLAAAGLGGKLYAFGGEFPGVYPDVDEFDPAAGAWQGMRQMPTPRHGVAAVSIGGAIYVLGGGTSFGFSSSPANEVFTP
jgi:Kelch motif/Galactose oxidase, central domain